MLTERSLFSSQKKDSPVPKSEEEQFFDAVLDSNCKKADALLQKNPRLLLTKADIEDRATNKFTGITGFQYALWVLDWPMCDKMLCHFEKIDNGMREAEQQFKGLPDLTQRHVHGEHVDIDRIRIKYLYFVDFYDTLFNEARSCPVDPREVEEAERRRYQGYFDREKNRQARSWENLMKRMNTQQKNLPARIILALRYAECEIDPDAPSSIDKWWTHLEKENNRIWLTNGKGGVRFASLKSLGKTHCPDEMRVALKKLEQMQKETPQQMKHIEERIAESIANKEAPAASMAKEPK